MDQATAARHRLEAVEVRTRSLCRVATPRCRPGSGGTDRRQPTWPLATRKQPRAHHRAANDLSQITRPSFHRRTAACLIRRTAGYGPVCPVVWEGRSRKTSPYPDAAATPATTRVRCRMVMRIRGRSLAQWSKPRLALSRLLPATATRPRAGVARPLLHLAPEPQPQRAGARNLLGLGRNDYHARKRRYGRVPRRRLPGQGPRAAREYAV